MQLTPLRAYLAGGLSYFASSDPDGLDSVTLNGCTVSETAEGERLDGTCIAQNAAAQHPSGDQMAGSPLATSSCRSGCR